jgi:small-conductance mechanosensitive channel
LGLAALQDFWNRSTVVIATVPAVVHAIILVAVAVAVALVAHRIVMSISRRTLSVRRPDAHAIITRLQGPLRLALVLLAINATLSALPPRAGAEMLGNVLQVAVIALAGWMTLICLDLLSAIYVRRFDLGSQDNLLARKHVTQVRVLRRTLGTLIVVVTVAAALMTFDSVRQFGIGLFASAGIAGIVVGLAARPVLSNLLAGVQLAITQPIRIDDAVVVENEWGRIEDITSTYVVIKLWDLRRLIVPLSYFIERPFQNWTRESSSLLGSVLIYTDYSVPVGRVREKVAEIVANSTNWDGAVAGVQVTDSRESTVELRVLVSARDSSAAFDLRCEIREKLIGFLQKEYPSALPRQRLEINSPAAPRTEPER